MKPLNMIILSIIMMGFAGELPAQLFYGENPLVSTYSIVARDPATGEMGVAVQSHWFSVGTIVSWGGQVLVLLRLNLLSTRLLVRMDWNY